MQLENLSENQFENFILNNKLSGLISRDIKINKKHSSCFVKMLKSYHANVKERNILLHNELYSIVSLLNRHEIQVIPFKSIEMSQLIYNNTDTVEFSDIDFFFFSKERMGQLRDILLREGYSFFSMNEIHITFKKEWMFFDFHFRLFPNHISNFTLKRQFLESNKLVLNNIPIVKIEPLIILLCIHGSKHCWERLDRIIHLSNLIKKHQSDIDWISIFSTANKEKCINMVSIGLYLSISYNKIFIPNKIRKYIFNKKNKKLKSKIYKRLFSQNFEFPTIQDHIYFNYMLADCKNKVVIFYLKKIFTPTAADRSLFKWHLPEYTFYFFRPIRLSLKYLFKII